MPSAPENPSTARARRLRSQGLALKAARLRLGLSQPAAAGHFGVSVWTYRSWEHGLRQPAHALRVRLVDEWGCDRKLLAAEDDARCPHCGRAY